MTATQANRASVLSEILTWSQGQPPWQQDALRRIIESRRLDDKAIVDLETMCRAASDATEADENVPAPVPLESKHVITGLSVSENVSLLAVRQPRNVNQLPFDAELTFGDGRGLVVVYGDNGSGKSGFARIVKAACRARGARPTIRHNVFAKPDGLPPQATLVFKVGDIEKPVTWTQGGSQISELGAVYVFDSSAAISHAGDDNAAEFTPFGLDILPELARVCDEVRKKLDSRRLALASQRPLWLPSPPVASTTAVYRKLKAFSAVTDEQDIRALADLDASGHERLAALSALLTDDPLVRAAATRSAANRLKTLSRDLQLLLETTDATVANLATLINNLRVATEAAQVAARQRFNTEFLSGTGGQSWQAMWESARAYSDAAYPDRDFPVTAEETRCLLCQQPLMGDARGRLELFEEFAQDTTQEMVNQCEKDLAQFVAKLDQTRRRCRPDRAADPDLVKLPRDVRPAVRKFLAEVLWALRYVKRAWHSRNMGAAPKPGAAPIAELNLAAAELERKAKEEEGSHDSSSRAALSAERAELEARKWLATVLEDCCAALKRERLTSKINRAADHAQTAVITNKARELAEAAITPVICGRFEGEIRALKLTSIDVELVPTRTEKGHRKFRCLLRGVQKLGASDIASEGEHRCIALAAFLAELSTATDRSAIVFDDPVCSLDHRHRRFVAARLAKEARDRQVIVFTHDLVLVEDLQAAAMLETVVITTRTIMRKGTIPGHVRDGLPWRARSALERIDALKKLCAEAEAAQSTLDEEAAAAKRRGLCDLLRDTIEIVIETVCFNGTVVRYRNYVNTKQLARASVLTEADCNAIKRFFDKTSDAVTAHSQAAGRNAPPPPVAEILADIVELEALVRDLKQRQSVIAS